MADQQQSNLYRLSYEIIGHSADVRAVAYCPLVESPGVYVLLTASRDGTACVWAPSGREFILKKVIKKHTGYVSSLCVIPADEAANREKTLFATGGQDNTILVHSTDEAIQEPLVRHTGHQGMISCIIHQHNQLISCSWDSTVRVWKEGGKCDVLEAHKPAVWAVAGLFAVDGSRRILTGGADKVIRLWEVDTKLCVLEYRGHTDVVRDVKVATKNTFFSAANDCVIKKWNLDTGLCLSEFYGHEAFVYSLSVFPGSEGDEFVTGGEDRTIRVWKGGSCVQVVPVPALSVWTVCCMANGDIAAGSSDGVARIFTTVSERAATQEELAVYDSKVVESRSSPNDNSIDVSKLPGMEALSKPGHAGGTVVVNNNGTPEVYQWSEEDQQWVLIGNALGKAPQKNNVFNGKEYDYVFDIELDEGSSNMRKLKLPYDKTMDPYLAAENFLSVNNLPPYYLDQVAEFIIQNAGEYHGNIDHTQGDPFTGGSRYIPGGVGGGGGVSGAATSDPFTGGSRYLPGGGGASQVGGVNRGGGADPFTGGSSYRPSEFTGHQPPVKVTFKGGSPLSNPFFPMASYKLFTSPQDYLDKVVAKVAEFNSTLNEDVKFSEAQLHRLKSLRVEVLTSSTADVQDLGLIETMLNWPPQCVFPALDLLRLALLGSVGTSYFIADTNKGQHLLQSLTTLASDPTHSKNQVPVLRALANFFAHELGTQVMDTHRKMVMNKLLELLTSCTNRTSQIAIATVVLNYCHYYGKEEVTSSGGGGVFDSVQFISQILGSQFDLEAKFRALIGLGTLAQTSCGLVLSAVSVQDLCNVIQPLASIKEPAKVKQCSECVLQTLQRPPASS